MSETRNINELVKGLGAKRAEVVELGAEIKKSGTELAVLFIDLVDSSRIKESQSDQDWLGYIFEFLETLANVAVATKGTVVKRIGDELLITFASAHECEAFIERIASDDEFGRKYPHKIAADYGLVYHLKFTEGLMDDPYGRPVDRCARLVKLAQAEGVLCSADYRAQLSPRHYASLGAFFLKGFSQQQEIFLRTWDQRPDIEDYLALLLGSLNRDAESLSGFRYVLRKHSPDDFKFTASRSGRPFLLRELINLPCLPYSLEDFAALQRGANNKADYQKYIGYLVDWSAAFESYNESSSPYLYLVLNQAIFSFYVFAHVPQSHSEMARELRKGDLVHVRGVITNISYSECALDYVDWMRSESTPKTVAPIKEDSSQAKVGALKPILPSEETSTMHSGSSPLYPASLPARKSWWRFGLG